MANSTAEEPCSDGKEPTGKDPAEDLTKADLSFCIITKKQRKYALRNLRAGLKIENKAKTPRPASKRKLDSDFQSRDRICCPKITNEFYSHPAVNDHVYITEISEKEQFDKPCVLIVNEVSSGLEQTDLSSTVSEVAEIGDSTEYLDVVDSVAQRNNEDPQHFTGQERINVSHSSLAVKRNKLDRSVNFLTGKNQDKLIIQSLGSFKCQFPSQTLNHFTKHSCEFPIQGTSHLSDCITLGTTDASNKKAVELLNRMPNRLEAHGKNVFACCHCKFKSKSQITVKKHLAQVHNAISLNIYLCNECKSSYQLPQDLEKHYRTTHKCPLSYRCLFCGKRFACLEMFRFHKRKHLPFSCKFCQRGFKKQEAFLEHLESVHKNDAEGDIEDGVRSRLPALGRPGVFEDKGSCVKVLEVGSDGSVIVREDCTVVIEDSVDSDTRRISKLTRKDNCPICRKLLTKQFLPIHMLSHKGKLPHVCQICPKAYAQRTLLRKHMKNRHYEAYLKMGNRNPKKKNLKCEFCEEIFFDVFPMEEHLWTHMDTKAYQCEVCEIKFGMKSNWLEHYKSHYFSEEEYCSSCGRSFKSIGFFIEHTERCRSKWKCEECGLECCTEPAFRKHNRLVHLSAGRRYDCQECGKKFLSNHNYKDHMLTHSSDKTYSCSFCEKVFKRRSPMEDHIQRVHSLINHVCRVCYMTFKSSIDLQLHKNVHNEELPCDECGVIYWTRATLDNHIMVNHSTSSDQPYDCCYCSKPFLKQIYLKNHLQIHFSQAIFVCQVSQCHKIFKKESLLRSHFTRQHSHLEFFCHLCLQKFVLDSDLQKHLETHRENGVMNCLKCKSSFSSIDELKVHMTDHSNESPFECSLCGVKRLHKNSVLKHIQTIHSISEGALDFVLVNRWKCSFCEKMLLTQSSMMKHLYQHNAHGIQSPVEGTLIKVPFSHQVISSTESLLTSEVWEDLLPSLKVHLVTKCDKTSGINVWQCSVCYILTKTENSMKKHILSSISCQETLLSLTKKHKRESPDIGLPETKCVMINDGTYTPVVRNPEDSEFVLMGNGGYIIIGDDNIDILEFMNDDECDNSRLHNVSDTVQMVK